MSDVSSVVNEDAVIDMASLWIAKLDAGLSKEEEKEFQQWVNENAQNRQAFTELAKLWDNMDVMSRLSEIIPEDEIQTNANRGVFSKGIAVAAVVVLSVVSSLFFLNGSNQTIDEGTVAYETSVGEQSEVGLVDGSRLTLNTNTRVSVDFDEFHRLITLDRGEMHIQVAHDDSVPLSVRVGNKVVQAVGTAFNVELLENKEFQLIVTDGVVRVGDRKEFDDQLFGEDRRSRERNRSIVRLPSDKLEIRKGQKILLGQNQIFDFKLDELGVETESAQVEKELAWTSGKLIFNGESLSEAISEIERYTSVDIIILDEGIKDVRVAGVFRTGDLEGLLAALDSGFNIASFRSVNGTIELYRGSNQD